MSKKEEATTITMTEEQLERVITKAVRAAIRASKDEDKLPGNQEDELKDAPVTYSMLILISEVFLGLIISIAILVLIACINIMYQNGFNFDILLFGIIFTMIGLFSFLAMRELNKTKKVEVLNTVFSAIMALSSLIVAIVGAYFAYKSTK